MVLAWGLGLEEMGVIEKNAVMGFVSELLICLEVV